jgi:large subunit ribosomal protein L21
VEYKRTFESPAEKGTYVYAIFEDGGRQYKVSEGDALLIDQRDLGEDQEEITFDRVLMVGQGEGAHIGTPWLKGVTVTARVTEELKTPKVMGVKFKRRKGYLKRFGHRQQMLKVAIEKINA